MYSIYTLNCPKSGWVKYVGVTTDLGNRYSSHVTRRNTNKTEWVDSLKKDGLMPVMKVLETTENKDLAYNKEIQYISLFKSIGYPLFNVSNGGKNPPSRKGIKYSEREKYELHLASTRRKTVQQLDKSGNVIAEFDGVREAGRITGIDHRSISQVAAGSTIRKSAGGFIWKYKEN
jgi:predicted GIY-YIG superfamily endonuclease